MPAPKGNRNAKGNRGGPGGRRENAGRKVDLVASIRQIRDIWQEKQHRYTDAEIEDIRTELGALLHEVAAEQPPEREWDGTEVV